MKLSGLATLAMGLVYASPAAATACRHSRMSSATSSASSASSSASASPSPSSAPSSPPAPVCDTNLLTNGDFSNNINFWTIMGNYAQTTSSCGSYANCMDMYFSSGGVQISNQFATQTGYQYIFAFAYYAAVNTAGASLVCNILDINGETVETFTPTLGASWGQNSGFFNAGPGTTSTVSCGVSAGGFTELQLADLSVVIPC